jgi:hypothetical protein
MLSAAHLVWIPTGALVGFLASFVFGDLISLPVDLYYLIYFSIVLGFFAVYVRSTGLDLGSWVRARLIWAFVAGTVVGLLMMRNVLSRPETEKLGGMLLWWGIFWRGFVYGTVDGILLFAFPWLVAWRAMRAPEKRWFGRLGVALLAWVCILLVTTAYHLGYEDFRSRKVVQPNIGSTIASVPTLVTANPVASVISHVFLHVTAVVHSPYTELFLPPHHLISDLRRYRFPRPTTRYGERPAP